MKKSEFNEKFRAYARTLSPTQQEQDLISKIYDAIKSKLGENNCIQIGSYPRFTAITPLHDLDILYIVGVWDDTVHNPAEALRALKDLLEAEFENPTEYKIKISIQTHSVTIIFINGSEEKLSLDIVPAYIFGKNEFEDDTYKVPEIFKKKHETRIKFYDDIKNQNREMEWITSDPRGYIKVASRVDVATNGEFRKTIKIIKKWKNNLEKADESLKLKSFHVEQVITNYFKENQDLEIFDAIFKFFVDLPITVSNPNVIADRANSDKFIDDYLEEFTEEQIEKIKQARDGFLIKLEEFNEISSIDSLMEINLYKRNSPAEQFLFDYKIPLFIDNDSKLAIEGSVKNYPGFREYMYKLALGFGLRRINKNNFIRFRKVIDTTSADLYKWKVKNDNSCDQPRGEITDNQTRNDPESTAYDGTHFVECYAIKNGFCISKARVYVSI